MDKSSSLQSGYPNTYPHGVAPPPYPPGGYAPPCPPGGYNIPIPPGGTPPVGYNFPGPIGYNLPPGFYGGSPLSGYGPPPSLVGVPSYLPMTPQPPRASPVSVAPPPPSAPPATTSAAGLGVLSPKRLDFGASIESNGPMVASPPVSPPTPSPLTPVAPPAASEQVSDASDASNQFAEGWAFGLLAHLYRSLPGYGKKTVVLLSTSAGLTVALAALNSFVLGGEVMQTWGGTAWVALLGTGMVNFPEARQAITVVGAVMFLAQSILPAPWEMPAALGLFDKSCGLVRFVWELPTEIKAAFVTLGLGWYLVPRAMKVAQVGEQALLGYVPNIARPVVGAVCTFIPWFVRTYVEEMQRLKRRLAETFPARNESERQNKELEWTEEDERRLRPIIEAARKEAEAGFLKVL